MPPEVDIFWKKSENNAETIPWFMLSAGTVQTKKRLVNPSISRHKKIRSLYMPKQLSLDPVYTQRWNDKF